MSVAALGSGISALPGVPLRDVNGEQTAEEPTNVIPIRPASEPEPAKPLTQSEINFAAVDGLSPEMQAFREQILGEMASYVADAERRLAQAREIERSIYEGSGRSVHAEDLNIGKHLIDGYNLTANSPAAGSIAWSNLHVVLLGVDYTIADGNTALKYVYFIKPASGTSVTLTASNTMPVLGPQDALIFVNNGGTPISVLESSVTYAVGPGVIGNAQLDTATQQVLSNLQASDAAMQSRIDGVITSYYQDNAPWPAGAASPGGGDVNMGDIWYDSNDGGAFRWTGASGTPANSWQRIADTDTSSIAAKVNTKVTTYIATAAAPPVAPAGGFTVGDLWMVSDQNYLIKRWDGAQWVSIQLGDAAISGVSGAKIGSGINGSNVTTGTVPAARIGAGVTGVNLAGATGTITPARLNAAFHMLY